MLKWLNETTVEHHLDNGNTITYKIVDGTAYHHDTDDTIVRIFERARNSNMNIQLRFYYGDTTTGRAWGDVETGYIGRSTGTIKVPLCISNSRSHGGPALLDHCIVKIDLEENGSRTYRNEYIHKTFQEGV